MQPYPQLKVEKWNRRHWAVFDGSELVCVTVYKKGAVEVRRRLERTLSPGVEVPSSLTVVQPPLETAALSAIV